MKYDASFGRHHKVAVYHPRDSHQRASRRDMADRRVSMHPPATGISRASAAACRPRDNRYSGAISSDDRLVSLASVIARDGEH